MSITAKARALRSSYVTRAYGQAVAVVVRRDGHLTLHDAACATYLRRRKLSHHRAATEEEVARCWADEEGPGGKFDRVCHLCYPEWSKPVSDGPADMSNHDSRVVDEDFLDMLDRRGTDPNIVNRIRRANERAARQWSVVVHIESEVEFALEASGQEEAQKLAHEQARRLVPEGGRYTLALIRRG